MRTESKSSFWTTLPGILTGIAAVLTAVTGLYLAVRATSDGGADVLATASHASSSGAPTSPTFVRAGSQEVPPPRDYELQQGGIKLPDKPPFLRVKEFAYGSSDGGRTPDLRKIELVITNTSAEPMLLDLTDRYFSLADDLGRRAELIGFCCDAQGEMLSPGESRTATVFFSSPKGWYGKSLAADEILFRVQGLLPVERATWSFRPLYTAD
jgi:hypothetical protein